MCPLSFKRKPWHTPSLNLYPNSLILHVAQPLFPVSWSDGAVDCLPSWPHRGFDLTSTFLSEIHLFSFGSFPGRGLDDVKNKMKHNNKAKILPLIAPAYLIFVLAFSSSKPNFTENSRKARFSPSYSPMFSPVQCKLPLHHCAKVNLLLLMSFRGYNSATVLSEFFRLFSWFIPLNTFCCPQLSNIVLPSLLVFLLLCFLP